MNIFTENEERVSQCFNILCEWQLAKKIICVPTNVIFFILVSLEEDPMLNEWFAEMHH